MFQHMPLEIQLDKVGIRKGSLIMDLSGRRQGLLQSLRIEAG